LAVDVEDVTAIGADPAIGFLGDFFEIELFAEVDEGVGESSGAGEPDPLGGLRAEGAGGPLGIIRAHARLCEVIELDDFRRR
jgi:hypothetical protein